MPINLFRRNASAPGPRRTYRQPAMLVPGLVLALICAGFLAATVIDGGVSTPGQILWPVAGLLLVWVIFVRPCVQLTQAGVVMRNLVRDVRFSWPSIDVVEQRWNLRIYDGRDKGYGSWAIAAQRPSRSASARRGGLRGGFGLGPIDPENPTGVMANRPGSSATVAAAIRAGQLDYAAATTHDATYVAKDEVCATVSWPAIGALALVVVCVVISVAL